MIYKLLLIQDYGVSIAHDAFKRIKPPRDSNRPCICPKSGIFYTNNANLLLQRGPLRRDITRENALKSPELPDLPHMNTSILRTCRLIHDEATPILYNCNSFCFSDLTTADTFCWRIGGKNACSIQEIGVNCPITCQEPHVWKDLSENFPQLKRMRLRLSNPQKCWRSNDFDIRNQLKELARHFRGLDWFQFQGYCSWKRLERKLSPMLERDSEVGLVRVQKHIAIPAPTVGPILPPNPTLAEMLGAVEIQRRHTDTGLWWTTLWWGRDGERPPKCSRNMR